MIINGRRISTENREAIEAINPATGECIGVFPSATPEEITQCLKAARQGQKAWARLSVNERAKILFRFPALLEEKRQEMAELLCREMGKPIRQCHEDIDVSVEVFQHEVEAGRHFGGQSFADLGAAGCLGDVQFTVREPLGVALCIAPFNFPLDCLTQKVSAALIMGNSVVIKPPSDVTLTLVRYTELMLEAGIPADVAQIITGRGSEIGELLVDNDDVSVISFTGSTEVGTRIVAKSAPHAHRVIMEMGGNDPFVIFEDADLKLAVEDCWMRVRNAGQTCCAAKRYIVHNLVKDRFAQMLVEWLGQFKMGDPTRPDTDIGTVINEKAARLVERQVNETLAAGAKLLCGGKRSGAFYEPTVLTDVTRDMPVAKDMEIFGPVFPIIGFDDEEEAVEIANQTCFGLNAGCLSADLTRSLRVASKLQAGTVVANGVGTWRAPEIPFGGYKMSGISREGGFYSLETFSQEKTIAIRRIK